MYKVSWAYALLSGVMVINLLLSFCCCHGDGSDGWYVCVSWPYSPLLGGCYVYDGCVNLLHTQVCVNCGYIRCELWLYQV